MEVVRLPPCCQTNDITEVGDSGPSLGEDGAGVRVDLGEADGSPAGTLQSKVKSPDAREERRMGGIHVMPRYPERTPEHQPTPAHEIR